MKIKSYKRFCKSVIDEQWAIKMGLDPYICEKVLDELRNNPLTCGFDDIEAEVRKRMIVANRDYLINKLLS